MLLLYSVINNDLSVYFNVFLVMLKDNDILSKKAVVLFLFLVIIMVRFRSIRIVGAISGSSTFLGGNDSEEKNSN